MKYNLALLLSLPLAVMVSSAARAADSQPSFDCAKAGSKIEKVICRDGSPSLAWFDQVLADVYKSVKALPTVDAAVLVKSQRDWLTRRNQCSGSEDKIYQCLYTSYQKRVADLAAFYDSAKVTGKYHSANINGDLQSVLLPDGTLAVSINSVGPAPGYNVCEISFRSPLSDDVAQYVDDHEATEGGKCKVTVKLNGRQILVDTDHCSDYCGYGVSFDGNYSKK